MLKIIFSPPSTAHLRILKELKEHHAFTNFHSVLLCFEITAGEPRSTQEMETILVFVLVECWCRRGFNLASHNKPSFISQAFSLNEPILLRKILKVGCNNTIYKCLEG